MPQIVLNEEQARVVAGALEPVAVRDHKGNLLAVIPPAWSAAEVAEAERAFRSGERGYTYAEVMAHLQSLEQR